MKRINISEVLSQACELTKKHWATFLVCFIGVIVVQMIIGAIFGGSSQLAMLQLQAQAQQDPALVLQNAMQALTASLGSSIVSGIVSFILMVGVFQTLLNCGRGHGDFTIDAWKQPAALYLKMFIAQIIVEIIVLIGLVFCVLPGLYLYARLQFYSFYMLDHKNCGVMDGIEASWNATKEDGLILLLLGLLYILLMLLGILCCCVGVIVAEMVVYFACVVCYLTLMSNNTPSVEPEPEYQK